MIKVLSRRSFYINLKLSHNGSASETCSNATVMLSQSWSIEHLMSRHDSVNMNMVH